MQEDLEVTGISRSGRVRKKSSKLMDFESPDDIETRFRRAPMKAFGGRHEDVEIPPGPAHEPSRPVEDAGTASGSESDFYENQGENADSMESDSSASDEGQSRPGGVANSLYMMEKSTKKKLIVKDGRVVGRAKAQRKDKGKTRITAYMLWAKEARNELLRKHPEMDFSAISKRLGEMWSNVNYNERYLWKRKAKRFAIQREQGANTPSNKIISNPAAGRGGPAGPGPGPAGRGRAPAHRHHAHSHALVPVSGPQAWGSGECGPVGTVGSLVPAPAPAVAGSGAGAGSQQAVYRVTGCGAVEVAAHLRLLGESLAIIGERLKEHEGQIAVSGSVSVLLDTLLCALAPLVCMTRALPAPAIAGRSRQLAPLAPIAPPHALLMDTLHNIAYIMPGL